MNLSVAMAVTLVSGSLWCSTCVGPAAARESAGSDLNCRAGGLQTQPLDVFLVAGQSNATGEPEFIGGSPIVAHGKILKYENGEITDGDDPVGGRSRGSAWPSFGVRYNQATNRAVMFVPASVPGSPLSNKANVWGTGFWATGGDLTEASIKLADAALACAGPQAKFKGLLWDQGENDAVFIGKGKETPEEYKSLLVALISQYRTHFGPAMPFFIFQTGSNGPNEAGYAKVRDVQRDVASEIPNVAMVFSGASGFAARG